MSSCAYSSVPVNHEKSLPFLSYSSNRLDTKFWHLVIPQLYVISPLVSILISLDTIHKKHRLCLSLLLVSIYDADNSTSWYSCTWFLCVCSCSLVWSIFKRKTTKQYRVSISGMSQTIKGAIRGLYAWKRNTVRAYRFFAYFEVSYFEKQSAQCCVSVYVFPLCLSESVIIRDLPSQICLSKIVSKPFLFLISYYLSWTFIKTPYRRF